MVTAFIIVTIILFIIGLILLLANKPAFKKRSLKTRGEIGEDIVASILGETVEGEKYIINDLLFETSEGHSCQIDHIAINKYGIYVIETKNYSGCIFGKEEMREWKQILGNEINYFYNPVKQNSTHVYNLSRRLGIKNVFKNVVIFMPTADISCVESDCVFYPDALTRILSPRSPAVLSGGQMERCYKILNHIKTHPTLDMREHVENINRMQEAIKTGICPRCGGKLVLRTGEYGEFYGCSNYPKCKFTKEIESEEIG